MFRYLYDTANNFVIPPVQLIRDLPEMCRGRNQISNSVVRLVYWLGQYMLEGRLIIHWDYEVLRTSRASPDEHSHRPRCQLEPFLLCKNNELPFVPNLKYENSLPPNLEVPKHLIVKYFPIFHGDLRLLKRADVEVSHDQALRIEIARIIAVPRAAYFHWNERVSLIPDPTYAFLHRALTEKIPNFVWM